MNNEINTAKEVCAAAGSEIGKGLTEPVKKLLNPTFEYLGELLALECRYFASDRYIFLTNQIQKKFSQRGISTPKKINTKNAIPFIKNLFFEDNLHLREKWIKLLTNVSDPNADITFYSKYNRIVCELEQQEAKIIEFLFKNLNKDLVNNSSSIFIKVLNEEFNFSEKSISIFVQNLIGLGLCKHPQKNKLELEYNFRREIGTDSLGLPMIPGISENEGMFIKELSVEDKSLIMLTDFGLSFCKACQ